MQQSLASRLLLGGLLLASLVIGSISAFLMISRAQQTNAAAVGTADNRAQVVQRLLGSLVAYQTTTEAAVLATDPTIISVLAPVGNVSPGATLLSHIPATSLGGSMVVLIDSNGEVVASDPASLGTLHVAGAPDILSVRDALAGRAVGGVEMVSGQAAYDAASPVMKGGKVVGAVLLVSPLAAEMARYASLIGYPSAFIPAAPPRRVAVFGADGAQTTSFLAPALGSALAHVTTRPVHAVYQTLLSGSTQQVVGSFLPVTVPGSKQIAGYVGVEVPMAPFTAGERANEIMLALLACGLLLLTALAIMLFVDRAVHAPIAKLEAAVRRIANGDLSTPVPVTTRDELGNLAQSVNTMRTQLQQQLAQVEASNEQIQKSVDQLRVVSETLTSTVEGGEALMEGIAIAAAQIAGPGAQAWLGRQTGKSTEWHGDGRTDKEPVPGVRQVLHHLRKAPSVVQLGSGERTLFVFPVRFQGHLWGCLAVAPPPETQRLSEAAQKTLSVLANSAAVALENAQLFDLQREAAERLHVTDRMKSELLTTVQHELRTPITVLVGYTDLLELYWSRWDEATKAKAVEEMQTASRNLYEIVETIIHFALLEGGAELHPAHTPVLPAVRKAISEVAARWKGSLPCTVQVYGDEEINVWADRDGFNQVLKALVDNAVKFTPAGGLVTVTAGLDGDGMARVSIADNGIGINEEAISQIFGIFFQQEGGVTRRFGGTGMGLALVERLVSLHGGRIEVASTPAVGSTFTVVWPSQPVEAGQAKSSAGVVHIAGIPALPHQGGRRRTH